MKNLYLLPTDKPSRLTKNNLGKFIKLNSLQHQEVNKNQNIYITSDEEIKEKDWFYYKHFGEDIIDQAEEITDLENLNKSDKYFKKITLTTDIDLIENGVQAIDDEFLEWFINNASCEEIRVDNENICARCHSNDTDECWSAKECSDGKYDKIRYKIIIPKEEPKQDLEKEMFDLEQELDIPSNLRFHNSKPKQEILEEAAERLILNPTLEDKQVFEAGAKWQAERMYSEEDIKNALHSVELKDNKSYTKIYTGMKEYLDNLKN